MADFLYFQTTIQTRIPIKEDGTLDKPEVVGRFTTPYKGTQGFVKKKAKPKVKPVKEEVILKTTKRETIEI